MDEEKQNGHCAVAGEAGELIRGVTPGENPSDVRSGGMASRFSGAGWVSGVLNGVRCGIRLTFFRCVTAGDLAATPASFAALALFDLFLHVALSCARVGMDGQFSFQYLPHAIIHLPLFLFAGFWVARLACQDDLALTLSTACLATGIPIDLLAELFSTLQESGWLRTESYAPDFDHFYPFFGWWALATLIALFRLTGVPRLRRYAVMAIFSVTVLLPLWNIPRGDLWSENNNESTSANSMDSGREETLYRQPELLDNALARFRPGRKGVEDLYFIGFAGYGGQDVFRKELEVIDRLLRDRFDTAGRSLLLVNNPDTLLKYPIATATSLERSLKRVGQVMDRDEDILLLYLTSHGSEDNHLSAELWPLTLHDIDPPSLRRMLDDSGVRWRIIVVSACYSGAFVDALRDDNTLVMTASDATSSSFGCSNDSDFTWFGKALFDDELRRTYSFTTAFGRASLSIAAREKKEGQEPSHPRIFEGRNIGIRLKKLEERLELLQHKLRTPRESGGATVNHNKDRQKGERS
ncbi:MAG: peptidase [Desulfuromonadales bacterium]|nr:peptidase [Desulfuromonadales bacterium]